MRFVDTCIVCGSKMHVTMFVFLKSVKGIPVIGEFLHYWKDPSHYNKKDSVPHHSSEDIEVKIN